MKSAGNGGVLKGILQVLHIHVLLVAPLGACHMAQPGTDQHQGRVAVRETAHHTGAAADLPVQPLNDIVGAELPSGKLPATRVRRRISLFSRSMTLLVRIRVQGCFGTKEVPAYQKSPKPKPEFSLR